MCKTVIWIFLHILHIVTYIEHGNLCQLHLYQNPPLCYLTANMMTLALHLQLLYQRYDRVMVIILCIGYR